ncbi:hypothetical protein HDU76_011011 [Blyttiomyces sp. JEL0837]|nr:hypothetical protein HDU76_011011 [Blyttiomyces sp. JEL0837]
MRVTRACSLLGNDRAALIVTIVVALAIVLQFAWSPDLNHDSNIGFRTRDVNPDKASQLPLPGDVGTSSSWAKEGKKWRLSLHNNAEGFPSGFVTDGQITFSTFAAAYGATFVFALFMLLCACALLSLICILISILVGFAGGVGSGPLISKALSQISNGILTLVSDTSLLAQAIPPAFLNASAIIKAGVDKSCDTVINAVDKSWIRTQMGGPNIGSGVGNTVLTGINSVIADDAKAKFYGIWIDGNVTALTGLMTTLLSLSAGNKFTVTPAFDTTYSTDLSTLSTSYSSKISTAQANKASSAYISASTPSYLAWIAAAKLTSKSWTDIGDTISAALLNRSATAKSVIHPPLNNFLDPLYTEVVSDSNGLVTSINGVHDSLVAILGDPNSGGGLQGADQYTSKIIPLILSVGWILSLALLVFIIFKARYAAKILLCPVIPFASLMLIVGTIFFIIAVIFGDVCAMIDQQNDGGLMNYSSTIDNLAFKFFPARQNDCLNQDKGFISMAVDSGFISPNTANITIRATPTINAFNLSALGAFYLSEVVPDTDNLLSTDSITPAANTLLSAVTSSNYLQFSTDTSLSGSIADLTALNTRIQTYISDVTTNAASAGTPANFVIQGSVTYADIANQFLPAAKTVTADITAVQAQLLLIKNTVTNINTMASAIIDGANDMKVKYPTLTTSYAQAVTTLTNFTTYANKTLANNIPNIRFNMLLGVEKARISFESYLGCADFAYDTVVIDRGICTTLVTGLDAQYYALLVVGFAYVICVSCYGLILNRLASRGRCDAFMANPYIAKPWEKINSKVQPGVQKIQITILSYVPENWKGKGGAAGKGAVAPEPTPVPVVATAELKEV